MQEILDKTLENEPPSAREMRGYPLMDELPRCKRPGCGRVLYMDEQDGIGVCTACLLREDRQVDLSRLLERHGVEHVEDLPTHVLLQHQAEHRQGVF